MVGGITALFLIDISLGNISDIHRDSLASNYGIAAFIVICLAFFFSQFFVLRIIKQKIHALGSNSLRFNVSYSITKIVQYVLAGIVVATILAILTMSQYHISLVAAAHTIGYGLYTGMAALLAIKFFQWYREPFGKNKMILILALASAVTVANYSTQFTVGLYIATLQPTVIGDDRMPAFMPIDPNNALLSLIGWSWTVSISAFVLLWIGIVMLIHPYSKKLGSLKFWSIMIVPLVFQLALVPAFYLGMYTPSPDSDPTMIILLFSGTNLFAGVLFAAAFLMVARSISAGNIARDFMVLAAFGIILGWSAGSGMASQAAFPPFGLVSVSFTGLAAYMVYVGLYAAAVTVSQDSALKESIRRSVQEQAKLLGNIGNAQAAHEIQVNVAKIAKKQSEDLTENTGVESSMSDEEIDEYINVVVNEIKTSNQFGKASAAS